MKRILALMLSFTLVLGLVSCSIEESEKTLTENVTEDATETAAQKTTEPKESEAEPATEEKPVRVYETADNPLTPERLAQIPIANDSMSSDELRQICVDYVCLSTTFQWVCNQEVKYRVERQQASALFLEGQLYGGIPYVNTASGNLYRVLECYDTETAIWDMTDFLKNNLLWGTACSGTASWGWQRVINSAYCAWTAGMTVKNGFIRVGSYVYDDNIERYGENGADDCSDIAKKNGEEVIYESYALMLKADCLVNDGHVRMCKENPVVVRDESGKIDPKKSYVIQCEQGLYTTASTHDRYTEDGNRYKIQGNDNLKSSFYELFKSGYLPHTFAEFLGTDPVEKAEASIETKAETVSMADLQKCTLTANYAISDVFTVIRNKDGVEVFRFVKRMPNHFSTSISLLQAFPGNAVSHYQEDGTHTIELSCQLSTGEVISAYRGTLKG